MKKTQILLLCFFSIPFIIFSSESDIYDFTWLDPDKEVYVLQNRKFRKSGRLYINAGGGMTTSGAFINASNIQFRGGFFFKEDWGLEGVYSLNSGKENETAKSVRMVILEIKLDQFPFEGNFQLFRSYAALVSFLQQD